MERWLTEKQASELTGLSPYTFQKWRWKGIGPPYQKVGGRVLYPLAELVDWMNSHGVRNSTSDEPRLPRRADPDKDEHWMRRWLPGHDGKPGQERYVLVTSVLTPIERRKRQRG